MSSEPPSLPDATDSETPTDLVELKPAKGIGYPSKNSETRDAIIGMAGALALFALMMAFISAMVALGASSSTATIVGMLVFFGGAFVGATIYTKWQAGLGSPTVVVPSTIRAGDELTVAVHGDADSVISCEAMIITTKYFRSQSGSSRKRNNREWSLELQRIDRPYDDASVRFIGPLASHVRGRPRWLIAVRLKHDLKWGSIRYARSFSLVVQPAETT